MLGYIGLALLYYIILYYGPFILKCFNLNLARTEYVDVVLLLHVRLSTHVLDLAQLWYQGRNRAKKMFLRDCMLKCIIGTVSGSLVFVIKDPGSPLEQALQLLVLGVL